MKKFRTVFFLVLVLCCTACITAQAKVGDVIGAALHTDIVAYINHYAVPSYAVNGQSVIVAEDLRNFGFDVSWNQADRTLNISRNQNVYVNEMQFNKNGAAGSKFADILETDIRVYANGKLLTSYALNGYTMIPLEELTVFGEVNWVPTERAVKLWVDGLHMRSAKQSLTSAPVLTGNTSAKYYPGTSVPDYTYVTGIPLKNKTNYASGTVYVYEDTEYGEYAEMIDYMSYLRKNGWKEYSHKNDNALTYYYVKGNVMIGISYYAKYDEVWITVLY